MKNQNRVHREGGAKGASGQARSKVTRQAGRGLKTYRVFIAATGETDMTKWQEGERVQARSPLDAARRHLREFKRLAVCRFNQGEKDYLFDLVKGTGARPASEGEGMTVVFLNHDTDEHFADVCFTAAEFAGIKEAAREMNLTLEEFCTRAVAEWLQRLALPAPALDAAPPVATVALLWPAKIADELHAAQRELDHAADAAVALALMNSHIIKEDVKGNSDWEDLALPRFDFGAGELARMAVLQLNSALERCDEGLNRLAGEARAHPEPVAAQPDSGRTMSAAVELRRPLETHKVECAVEFMAHCLATQGAAMCDRGSAGAHAATRVVNDRLNTAWREVLMQSNRLVDAVLAVRAPQPSAEERRAA